MKKRQGFTLIELLVVISIIALLIGILLPALGAARRTARQMQSNTQVRGIHQGMVIFAQGNNQKFPGMTGQGAYVADGAATTGSSGTGDTVEARYWILLNGNFFTGEYAISPVEQKTAWTTGAIDSANGTAGNYSYSFLNIEAGTATHQINRRNEWSDTINTEAAVVTDRTTVNDASNPRSIHSTTDWRGSVGYNDNHVLFETTHLLRNTKYGSGGTSATTDNIFSGVDVAASNGNALLVFKGTATLHGT